MYFSHLSRGETRLRMVKMLILLAIVIPNRCQKISKIFDSKKPKNQDIFALKITKKLKFQKQVASKKFNFVTQGQLWLSRWLQKIISSFSKKNLKIGWFISKNSDKFSKSDLTDPPSGTQFLDFPNQKKLKKIPY